MCHLTGSGWSRFGRVVFIGFYCWCWFGSVRFGSVRFGSVRLGLVRLGSVRLGKFPPNCIISVGLAFRGYRDGVSMGCNGG